MASADLQRGIKEIDAARPGYDRAESYYHGTASEVFSSSRLNRLLNQDDAYYLNYARIPVVSRLARIEIAAVTVPADDNLTTVLQDRIWNENDLILMQKEVHESALVYGDVYVTAWPGEEDGTVEIDIQNPKGARLIYRQDNPRRPAFGIKIWPHENKTYRANLYYADRVEKWISIEGKSNDAEQWVEFQTDEEDWIVANPFGIIPFFHFSANGHPYGTPVHKNAFGPQDAITKTNATLNATVEFHGFPQRYALSESRGISNSEVGDQFGGLGGSDFGTDAIADTSANKLRGGPKEMQFFEGVKTVGEFTNGDSKNFLDPLAFFIRSMATVTETPFHYFDPQGDSPSGESLRVANAPLVKSVDDIKLGLTRPWSKLLSFSLAVLGSPAKQVDVRFADSESTDDSDGWAVAAAKLASGVPVRQVLLEQGYTDEQIDMFETSAPLPNIAPPTE